MSDRDPDYQYGDESLSDSDPEDESSDDDSESDQPPVYDYTTGAQTGTPFDLKWYDPIIDIETRQDADKFVASAMKHGSKADIDELRYLVIGPTLTRVRPVSPPRDRSERPPVKRARQFGGAGLEGSKSLSRFFELIDAVHDFGTTPARREQLRRSIGAELPIGLMTGPEPQNLHELTDYDKLFRNMTKDAVLKFPNGETVSPNPLVNIEAGVYKHSDGLAIANLAPQTSGPVRNEHLFMKWSKKANKVVLLTRLQKFRLSIDEFYEADQMMIDQDMTPYSEKEDAHRHLFAWMVGFKHVMASVDSHFDIEANQKRYRASTVPKPDGADIEFVYCDANIYDGAKVDKFLDATYSDAATGHVFHKESVVKFKYKEYCGPPVNLPRKHAFSYEVQGRGSEFVGLTHVFNGSTTGGPGRERYGTAFLKGKMDQLPDTADVSVLAALKRAGDWGQIEHCRENEILFVTCDRALAFYATYRGVNVLLLRHDKKLHNDGTGKFVQYSFAMFRPVQSGGSGEKYAVRPWALAFLAITAFVAALVG